MRWATTDPENRHDFAGVVIHIGDGFVAFAQFENFEYSGIQLLPINALASTRYDKQYKVATEIITTNGHIKKAKAPAWLRSCQTLQDALTSLMNRDIWISLDLLEKKDTWFFIGKITNVEEDGFLFRSYYNTGRWAAEQGFYMKDVHTILFDDPYANHFNKYVRARLT